MNAYPTQISRALVAAAAALALLAVPSVASAAPDWTPAVSFPDQAFVSHGYAGGKETRAHLEVVTRSPVNTRIVVSTSRPGEPRQTELEVPTTSAGFPFRTEIAVAPGGEAVLAWQEIDPKGDGNTPSRFHVRYRSASGEWEPEKVVLTDDATDDRTGPTVRPVIGADGTAVVAINHHEKDDAGETVPDQRADVVVHPAGGSWEAPFRLSAANRSSVNPDVGVDRAGNITATYAERYNEATGLQTALVRRRAVSNKVWTTAEDITQSAPQGQAGAPALDVAPDGRAVIAVQRNFKVVAAVRESASGSFGALTRASSDNDQAAVSDAALAPDGTAYVVYAVSLSAEGRHVGLVRAAPGASFSAPRRISPGGIERLASGIAFAGNDAVVGWTGQLSASATDVVQGTRWPAGSSVPDAFQDLDTASEDGLDQVVSDREGSVVVAWSGVQAHTATFDGGGPVARTAEVPEAATAGEAVTLRGSFADRWSALAGEPSWDFGDGATASGGEVAHSWAAPGDYTVTLRAADTFGNATERRFTVHVSEGPAAPAPAAPAQPAPAAPRVTLKPPKCPRSLSRAACKRFLIKPATWKKVGGTASDAPGVTVTVKRKGSKTRTVKVSVRSGKWTARLSGLKAGGTTTISARAIAADGTRSKAAARKLKLRR